MYRTVSSIIYYNIKYDMYCIRSAVLDQSRECQNEKRIPHARLYMYYNN